MPRARRLATAVCSALALLATAPAASIRGGDLADQALIRRDAYGVAHILAQTEEAAAFAHGYVTAEDHLETLARLVLRARGERAAVMGERAASMDFLVRQLGIYEVARERFADLSPLSRAIYEAYAGGYNLYLARHPDRVPTWATPISGVDVLAHCRAVLLLDFAFDRTAWAEPAPRSETTGSGSNAWAIGKGRSHSGRGILLANPHLNWEPPTLMQEIHIRVPGVIDVSGATFVGFPFVGIGFNEYLGWSHTVNKCDSDEVYDETLAPQDSTHYLYDGEARPLTSRTITIRIKTAGGVETRSQQMLWSHHGPIIRVANGHAYAFKSANHDVVDFLAEWNAMAKARSLTEFRAALERQALPMFHIVYADRDGNTFYVYNCRVPVKAQPAAAQTVAGDTSKTEWTRLYRMEELPQVQNPKGGYVQNCNDSPSYVNAEQRIPLGAFERILSNDRVTLRGQISLHMLEADADISLDEVKRYKMNDTVLLAQRVKPPLVAAAKGQVIQGTDLSEAAAVLERWDDRTSAQSRGAVLFVRWWEAYSSAARPVFARAWNREHPLETPAGLGDPGQALAALATAAAAVRREYGALDVAWGDVFRLRRGSLDLPISGAPSALGSFRTIAYRRDPDNRWEAVSGDSYVLAVEFTDPPTAYSILAYSASSDPRSTHYSDQSALFARGEFKPAWFTEKDIDAHTERTYRPGR